MCCSSKTKRIRDVIDYVSTQDKESGQERIIFATDKTRESEHYLHGNPVSFVVTNINSMMGGKAKMWDSGKGKNMGIADSDGKARQHNHFNYKDEVAHDDDHLEFETVSSVFHLVLGKGLRVAQEKGPFTIHFKKGKGTEQSKIEEMKQNENGELEPKKVEEAANGGRHSFKKQRSLKITDKNANLHTYMQIDGEYYKLINPDKITIRLSPSLSRLRVLRHIE